MHRYLNSHIHRDGERDKKEKPGLELDRKGIAPLMAEMQNWI
jgi:hypothetical protein